MKGGLALCSVAKSSSFSEVPKVSLPQRLLPTSWLKKEKKKVYLHLYFLRFDFLRADLVTPCVFVWSSSQSHAGCSLVTFKRPSGHVHSFQYLRPNHLSMKSVSRLDFANRMETVRGFIIPVGEMPQTWDMGMWIDLPLEPVYSLLRV